MTGPTAARQLADWGADVIKIEMPPAIGRDTLCGARDDFDFQNLHRNKRSLTLNLKSDAGREIFLRLAATADVVIENFRPDVKHRLKIDNDRLAARNPRLVYGSISGFGQEGPYANRPGLNQIAQGMGGLMSVTGAPGQGPMRVGIPLADLSVGFNLAMGIMIALYERAHGGRGQWVHTSLLAAQIAMMDFQAARYLMGGQAPGQAGNNHPVHIPTGVYATRDGAINIQAAAQNLYARLCEAIGAPDLIDHPDFAEPEARAAHRDRLNAAINREPSAARRGNGSRYWRRRAFRPGRFIVSIKPSTTRRCGCSTRPPRLSPPMGGSGESSARPSRCRARRARCGPRRRRWGRTPMKFCVTWAIRWTRSRAFGRPT